VRIGQALYTFWHTGDVRWLHEAVDPSFTGNTLPPGRPQGIDGPATASASFRAAVADLACELADLLVIGDKLAVRLRFTGHFTGTFNGIAGQGEPVEFIAFDIQHARRSRSAVGRRWVRQVNHDEHCPPPLKGLRVRR
jgi:predicted ester cyclase